MFLDPMDDGPYGSPTEIMTPPVPERRKFKRFEQRLLLKFRCVSAGLHKDSQDRVGMLADISKGGVELKSKKGYPEGAILQLKMPDSPIFKAKIHHVKVLWSKPVGPQRFSLGCRFVILKKK